MLRDFIWVILVALVSIIAYRYLNNFAVYTGQPMYVNSVFGRLKGRMGQARGELQIFSFTSIPYAKPPVGDLRFEPPVPYGKWEDEVLDATILPKPCLQIDKLMDKYRVGSSGVEDCLTLQIYTPNLVASKPLLPVMVFLHGGHFMFGSNQIFGPDYLLQNGDVVLVTVNYRLNSLGFLSTGDEVVPGNMGLKDQALALKWIQRAIRDFGGDPDKVTIFGESAGAASVNYHILSPMSKGLFARAISQSGTSLCPWAITRNPKAQAKRLAEKLNCAVEASKSSLELVNCLKKKNASDIVAVHKEIIDIFHDVDAMFGPTIEQTSMSSSKNENNVFLPDSPYKLYESGQFNKVPWITGVTSEEGCFRSSLILPYEDKLSELNEKWSQVVPKTFYLYTDDKAVSDKVRNFYFGNGKKKTIESKVVTKESPANERKEKAPQQQQQQQHQQQIGWDDLESLTNAFSDRCFYGCVHDAAIFHAKHAPVYLYYYTYKPDITFGYIQEIVRGEIPVYLEVLLGYIRLHIYRNVFNWDVNDYGVCHTDELQNFFRLDPLLAVHEASPHYDFSVRLVNLWTSFAMKGKPDSFGGVSWTPLQVDKKTNMTVMPLQYLRLGKVPAMIDEPFTKRLKFWEDLNLPKN